MTGNLLALYAYAAELKRQPRKGWNIRVNGWHRKVPDAETVASHTYSVLLLAMANAARLAKEGYDVQRIYELIIVHDLVESIVEDVVWIILPSEERKRVKAAKAKAELAAAQRIRDDAGGELGELIYQRWVEYEKRETRESIIAYELDKLDFVYQARDYAARPDCTIDTYVAIRDHLIGRLTQPLTLELYEELRQAEVTT